MTYIPSYSECYSFIHLAYTCTSADKSSPIWRCSSKLMEKSYKLTTLLCLHFSLNCICEKSLWLLYGRLSLQPWVSRCDYCRCIEATQGWRLSLTLRGLCRSCAAHFVNFANYTCCGLNLSEDITGKWQIHNFLAWKQTMSPKHCNRCNK